MLFGLTNAHVFDESYFEIFHWKFCGRLKCTFCQSEVILGFLVSAQGVMVDEEKN